MLSRLFELKEVPVPSDALPVPGTEGTYPLRVGPVVLVYSLGGTQEVVDVYGYQEIQNPHA